MLPYSISSLRCLSRESALKKRRAARADRECVRFGKIAVIIPAAVAETAAVQIAAQRRYDDNIVRARKNLLPVRLGYAEASGAQLGKAFRQMKAHFSAGIHEKDVAYLENCLRVADKAADFYGWTRIP